MKKIAPVTLIWFFLFLPVCPAYELPTAFDLRNVDGHAYIGPVRNQGDCGSCWSFSALAALESTWNRANGLYDDAAVDLSEAFLVWSLSPLYDGLRGCDGGRPGDTLLALVEYGAPLEADFPYTVDDPVDDLHWDAPRIAAAGGYSVSSTDYETIKRVIHTCGAVKIGLNARGDFGGYEEGILRTDVRGYGHAVSLIGWNDEPESGETGYWILRNSWGEDWGEDGYMRIGYESLGSLYSMDYYVMASPWTGEDVSMVNEGAIEAEAREAGGLVNAHAVDVWGGTNSEVVNNGSLLAQAQADDNTVTARGVYLWGGPQGRVENHGTILSAAQSRTRQAIAYGISLQGSTVVNSGQITVQATAFNEGATDYAEALANGVQLSNGGNPVSFTNSGNISATAAGIEDMSEEANGLWVETRGEIDVTNSGSISAQVSSGNAKGIMVTRSFDSPAADIRLVNSGSVSVDATASRGIADGIQGYFTNAYIVNHGKIEAHGGWRGDGICLSGENDAIVINTGTIESSNTSWMDNFGIGVFDFGMTYILNSGHIMVTHEHEDSEPIAIISTADHAYLFLDTGSCLDGSVKLRGDEDWLTLMGTGSEDDAFEGVEHMVMNGDEWSLSGECHMDSSVVTGGRLIIDGTLHGDVQVDAAGILGGSGTITGAAVNHGEICPGHSIGHLTIEGDYTHAPGAVLEIEVGDGTNDTLSVSGTADIQGGTLRIVPDGYVPEGSCSFLDALVTAGSFDQVETPAVLNVSLTEDLSLALTRNSYTSLTGHDSMASALDRMRPEASGDMATILNELDQMNPEDISLAMSDLSPDLHSTASCAALAIRKNAIDLVRARSAAAPHAPAGEGESGATGLQPSFWTAALGSGFRYDDTPTEPAMRQSTRGHLMGVDYSPAENLAVGMAISRSHSSLKESGSSGSSADTSSGGYLYSSWDDQETPGGMYVQTVMGFGRHDIDSEREIGSLDRMACSRHDGHDYSLHTETGFESVGERWSLGTSLGLEYVRLHEEGFEEVGAEAANLQIAPHSSEALLSVLGFSARRTIALQDLMLAPGVRAEWAHDYRAGSNRLEADFMASGEKFSDSGRKVAADAVKLSAGIEARLHEDLSLYSDYACTLQKDGIRPLSRFDLGLRYAL